MRASCKVFYDFEVKPNFAKYRPSTSGLSEQIGQLPAELLPHRVYSFVLSRQRLLRLPRNGYHLFHLGLVNVHRVVSDFKSKVSPTIKDAVTKWFEISAELLSHGTSLFTPREVVITLNISEL